MTKSHSSVPSLPSDPRPLAPAVITVLGDGGWGTALALVAARAGHQVRIWSAFPDYAAEVERTRLNPKFLPGIEIPGGIRVTADASAALSGATAVVSAIPTQFIRPSAARLAAAVPAGCLLVSASKGLERGTLERPSQILAELLPGRAVAVLSGPSHAEEVARGLPASVVSASRDEAAAELARDLFMGPAFRIYTSSDILGVELAAALKNVIALAAGMADGLGLGDNAKAALITRGLAELSRLGVALGADAETFSGLSGLGDLVVTCASQHSRNRRVGERLGRGEKLADILAGMQQVAEGVATAGAILELARKAGVELPIAESAARVLAGADPRAEVRALMTRSAKAER
ncbi:MAG TPA: NAD(P)H-dependent glycerol-3-phosphate dehydrogenase [Planctomycetota bacterium]|nr:NAD(P)H-dependent glycerol-3-phosphate dehydrogenase [Planctomycetota bacterium]